MQYTPFASDIELPFYTALASLKINHDKLDDAARKIIGLYEIRLTDSPNISCRMQIHGNALTNDEVPAGYFRAEGIIKNVNTIEDYRNMDKSQILRQSAKMVCLVLSSAVSLLVIVPAQIWDAINDGTIYSCPSLLSSFVILSYADLKKYKFHYWFGFPALHSDPSWGPSSSSNHPDDPRRLGGGDPPFRTLSNDESLTLVEAVQTWSYSVDARQRGFFLARRHSTCNEEPGPSTFTVPQTGSGSIPSVQPRFSWEIASLSSYEEGFFEGAKFEDSFICFSDPSNYSNAPGWMLRNLLVLVRQRWKLNHVQIMRYRDVHTRRDKAHSSVLILESKALPLSQEIQSEDPTNTTMPKVTGWERNPAGKLMGRLIDLTEYLDPKRLADQSVDLNLKLMKWRISPNLDLEKIKRTKCLLLGAGTLGSYVARNLMGWGVTKITFVDNGTVSFSNPVRQPLFNFTDCLEGGTRKAYRAAQALSEIYPGVDSSGHVLSVPMAGHPVVDTEKTRTEFEALRRLIDDHDAIFILMDTRESRWLPTVMGKAADKIVMNAALGFDSFVVMRHGIKSNADPTADLGCYFCNDVVAPMNSVKGQTLDQQCTVTRPGVAAIASALFNYLRKQRSLKFSGMKVLKMV
ncbi:Autophagy protein 7 [Aspergillus nanangensis]|uniref:Ubiquitin-like modifier-activating enzyme ATG7 n=1 Tax=Aspergillus nanangensis TaxID=2582783 RepID=A0AAD4CJ88_ASPNN|nr:Autophagy protein 7 [Aspergillus nanangensis]